jgi:CubicO group peptidase (beta-lactamase class C family)
MKALRSVTLIIASTAVALMVVPVDASAQLSGNKKLDSLVMSGLKGGYYPGASFATGNRNGISYEKCYGWHDYDRTAAVTEQDVYDLASVTKAVATTLAVMRLHDEQKLSLRDRTGDILPQFDTTTVGGITLRELLMHTSGLGNIFMYRMLHRNPTGGELISRKPSEEFPLLVDRSVYLCIDPQPDTLHLSRTPRAGYRRAGEHCYVNPAVDTVIFNGIVNNFDSLRRGKYLYSDLNFHLLMLICERVSGQPLNEFVAGIYSQMDMENTGYRPLEWKPEGNIIPTENDVLMARGPLRGYTHDEIAAVSGNVGGNAGLFSCAADLSRFCRMLLGGGQLDGRMIISPATIRLFTSGPRPLGFQYLTSSPMFSGGFGHTGYTGTMIWIDARRNRFMVFLSNRVHPTRTNQLLNTTSLRTKIWEAICNS